MTKLTYTKALERLNKIIEEMQSNEVDIEKTAQLVKEASSLVKACRKLLASTQDDIDKVLNQMKEPPE